MNEAVPPLAEALRVLVVDDEAPARARLRDLLGDVGAQQPNALAGMAANGVEALRLLEDAAVDVVLADIRMPVMDGVELARHLARLPAPPALVFVTAYDQYAVQAFEAQAIDYLLKPVQPARLQKSVQKLRLALDQKAPTAIHFEAFRHLQLQATAEQLRQLLAVLQPAAAPVQPLLRQLQVSPAGAGGDTIRMVPLSDVLYLQAADKYVRVVTLQGEHLLRTPLKDLLARLDPAQFWQIHRATLVRADAIDCVQRDETGKLHLSLRGSRERLGVSRLYAHLFKAL